LQAKIQVCESPFSADVLLGKKFFNLARSPMSRLRWISCSSCHPDGDHDGRVWQQPEGLRRATHFFGMSRTYPLHWSADRDELQDFEHTIRGPLMQGYGLLDGKLYDALGEPNAGRSKNLDALAAYCNSLEAPISPHAAGPGKLSAAAERGKALFFAKETKCADCHSGPMYTDRKRHDVGTGRQDKTEKMGFEYDTPSLVRTYRNTSWMHDGSAKTLRDAVAHNPGDRHGKTSHLSADGIDDLVEFLKSLPYEK
jgi:cytochrome c peroxidase